jgi:hypothetical protein
MLQYRERLRNGHQAHKVVVRRDLTNPSMLYFRGR